MQERKRQASRAEQLVSRWLRSVLEALPKGAPVNHSKQFREMSLALERFIPEVLRDVDSEWEDESLDGFLPLYAIKTKEQEMEVYGLCIIISDQTLTPIHLRIRAAVSTDEIEWMRCRLGERQGGGITRVPYSAEAIRRMLAGLAGREEEIGWVYKAEFGQEPDES
jgi:hypothetical protein